MKTAVCTLIGCLVIGAVATWLLDGVIYPQWEHARAWKHNPDRYYWEDTKGGFWPKSFIEYMEPLRCRYLCCNMPVIMAGNL